MIFKTPHEMSVISIVALFLATPFAAQIFIYSGWVFFASIPAIIFSLYILWRKNFLGKLCKNSLIILFGLMVAAHIYGIFLSEKYVSIEVIKDVIRGLAFFVVAILLVQLKLMANSEFFKKITGLFFKIVMLLGFIGAISGLAKYWLMQYNFRIETLADNLTIYPWGTSLLSDYNFYALSLLISGLMAIGCWSNCTDAKKSFLWSLVAGIVFNAGFLAGSRRFWLLAPILIVILLLKYYINKRNILENMRWKELLAGFVVITFLIQGGLYITNSPCNEQNLTCIGANNELELRVKTLVENKFVDSRVNRWLYTFEIIEPSDLLFGSGFSYREKFGCKFNECKIDDYPHAPILSALLYGGVIGFLSVLGCLVYALVTAYQILTRHSSHADFALGLIATTLFVLISGDSLLSMPIFFSMLLISRCVVWLK